MLPRVVAAVAPELKPELNLRAPPSCRITSTHGADLSWFSAVAINYVLSTLSSLVAAVGVMVLMCSMKVVATVRSGVLVFWLWVRSRSTA